MKKSKRILQMCFQTIYFLNREGLTIQVIRGAIMIGPLYDIDTSSTVAKHSLYNNKTNAEIVQDLDAMAFSTYGHYYAPNSVYMNLTSKYAWYGMDALVMAIVALDSFFTAYNNNVQDDYLHEDYLEQLYLSGTIYALNTPTQLAAFDKLQGVFKSMPSFNGTTGEVRFRDNNDRESDMYVYQFDGYEPADGSGANVLLRGVVKLTAKDTDQPIYTPTSDWTWYTADGSAPVTYSVMAYRWRQWAGYTTGVIVLAVAAPLATKFVAIPFVKQWKLKSALSGRWYRPAHVIRKIRTLDDFGEYVMTRATHHSSDADSIDATLHSNHGAYKLMLNEADKKRRRHSNLGDDDNNAEKVVVIVNVARSLRGATNITRQLTREAVRSSKALFLELIAMQKMVGKQNVAQFYGCVFTAEIVGTCYEWQPNGTLQQIIKNAPFELDLELTLSLVADVVRGKETYPSYRNFVKKVELICTQV